jgi:lipid-A-disaccharide synthase
MRIFISTGEASGDAYGAALVAEMKRLLPGADYEGTGAARMKAQGVRLIADSSSWGAVSIAQALRVYPRIRRVYGSICRSLDREPGLFVPIDFGYMNIRLARKAKARGWKVLYFVPPGSWRRDRQGKDLPSITDEISTPFAWSADILNGMGACAHWFGHPIRQLLRDAGLDLEQPRNKVAVLPGSRRHEIEANLPVIAAALADLPDVVEFGLAPTVHLDWFQSRWLQLSGRSNDLFTVGRAYDVLARGKAAIVCSGTATLEAALCKCPMVVLYRLTRSMQIEAKLLRIKRPKYVALPNILLDRMAIPELVNDEAEPRGLRERLNELLSNGDARAAQLVAFREFEVLMGPDDAITKTAELCADLIG